MKAAGWVLALVLAAALAAVIVRGHQVSRERDRRLEQLLVQDSLQRAAWAGERTALVAELDSLRADSATLARNLAISREASGAAVGTIERLLDELKDTSAARQLRAAIQPVRDEGASCALMLSNCEQRAANAQRRATGDSLQLARSLVVRDSLADGWRRAQAREGKRCGVGGTAGWGGGWNASLGVTCLFVRGFRLPWPF